MQEEKATYAMLVGVPKASKELNITPELLTRWIKLMNFQDSKLFRRLREKILERAMKKNARNAARHFGLTENIVVEMLKEYLSDEANNPDNTIYPHNTYDRFAQTCNFIQQPNWKHIGIQTESQAEHQPSKYNSK
ncbi:unnamed protein product [Blepharisma stoltei]|uniref:Transposase n=1 Tax=Blepharisma stoltei TaxID=1481888 RepID=A0AAU9JRD0_9CILI|nr:unnamed protein product [Blepharisma stoltei]